MTQQEIEVIMKSKRKVKLKALLSSTDYKVIKCYEAQLEGSQPPYDVAELIAQRKAWRSELEEIMEFLSKPQGQQPADPGEQI